MVVLQGRNVPPGRLLRAIQSLQAQRRRDWGAVLLNDGSSPMFTEFVRVLTPSLGPNWTVIHTPIRRGGMANLVWAIRHVCDNPKSVIVTLDADDALIGCDVLDQLHAVYQDGADLTVGSMLRTDKDITYQVHFDNARFRRGGGCVWQHLRSFRKELFDRIPDTALQLDGKFIDVAQDWAYMLAMVELAIKPMVIQKRLYLYEPSGEGKGAQTAMREAIIGRIVAMPPLFKSTGDPAQHEETSRCVLR
ncbi:MAG: glycosyltransferase [Myxococcales bacterium]|nr:glycosyltransferase [Myxococcales bacterium]